MLSIPGLENLQVFAVPFNNHPLQRKCILYSPLAKKAYYASPENIILLEKELGTLGLMKVIEKYPQVKPLFSFLPDGLKNLKYYSVNEFNRLFILPTNECNFSCTYCFSARGREHTTMSLETLRQALDFFINKNRTTRPNLFISFAGGGEPLLAPGLFKSGIEITTKLARQRGFRLDISLITNASVLNEGIVQVLKDHKVTVTASFEIIERIQNIHRGHYKKVTSNILKLVQNGINTRIRSIITIINVELQEEMVHELIHTFPGVKEVMFEPVTFPEPNEDPKELRKFFELFNVHFFRARELANSYGIKLECNLSRNSEMIVNRYCQGYFVLTPLGDISICLRITSPAEKGYHEMVYGNVNSEKVYIDQKKFSNLTGCTVCAHCFARWNCGGGCLAQRMEYNSHQFEEVCHFTRNFIKTNLKEKLDKPGNHDLILIPDNT